MVTKKEKIYRVLCDDCETCGKKLSTFEKDMAEDYRKNDRRFSEEDRKEILCFSCLSKRIEERLKW